MAGRNPLDDGYKMVAERHAAFVNDHPTGVVLTELVNSIFSPSDGKGFVVVAAKIWKKRESAVAGEPPDGTGLASMPIPGVTNFTRNSEVENTETSAIGRALAAIGYHPKDTMASQEEIAAKNDDGEAVTSQAHVTGDAAPAEKMTTAQRNMIFALAKECGIDKELLGKIRLEKTGKHNSEQMSKADGSALIEHLQAVKQLTQAAGGTAEG